MFEAVLKWNATVLLIVGTVVNNLGYQPAGPLILIAGGLIWLVVSIMWRDAALITTNVAMTIAGISALAYRWLI